MSSGAYPTLRAKPLTRLSHRSSPSPSHAERETSITVCDEDRSRKAGRGRLRTVLSPIRFLSEHTRKKGREEVTGLLEAPGPLRLVPHRPVRRRAQPG